MTRSKPQHPFAALALLIPLAASPLTPAADPAPVSARVEVVSGEGFQSRELRRELSRELIDRLDQRGCFGSVSGRRELDGEAGEERDARPETPARPGTDVVVRVSVDSYEERSDFDVTVGQLNNPNALPDTQNRVTAIAELRIHAALELPDGTVLRERKFLARGSHRPVVGEDPRARAREEAVSGGAEQTLRTVCKGGRKKLRKRLDAALAAAKGS